MKSDPVDVRAIRRHFAFPELGRIVTNNAASTSRRVSYWRCTPRSRLAMRMSTGGSPPRHGR